MLFFYQMTGNSKLTITGYGDPLKVIEYSTSAVARINSSSIEVSVDAAPINPADINLIQGSYGIKPALPLTLGLEGSGTIVSSENKLYPEGAQVIFLKRIGTWCERAYVSPSDILVLNTPIDPLQASMLKVNPMTAWRLLTAYSTLQKGDYVIQNAANSGVGQCVIQLAKLLGIKTICLARRKELLPSLLELGADHAFLDNSEAVDQIKSLTGEANAPKLAFNAVGGDSALRLMNCLAGQGKHITYGAMSKRSLKVPNKFLIFKRISIHGLWVTEDLKELPRERVESIYHQLSQWVGDGRLIQSVDSTYSYNQYQEALEHHIKSPKNGKIIFQPSK